MTDNTRILSPDELRLGATERMTQLARTLHNLEVPGLMSHADQLATYRELGVNSRGEARGRLRTEWLRMKNYRAEN